MELIDRYVAMWNESDPDSRRAAVRELWAENGSQFVTPPQDMVDASRALGFPRPVLECRGHDEVDFRVSQAYQEFVAPGEYEFRARGGAARIGNVVKLSWDMVTTADGAAVGGGTDMLVLDEHGRILTDHQFVD